MEPLTKEKQRTSLFLELFTCWTPHQIKTTLFHDPVVFFTLWVVFCQEFHCTCLLCYLPLVTPGGINCERYSAWGLDSFYFFCLFHRWSCTRMVNHGVLHLKMCLRASTILPSLSTKQLRYAQLCLCKQNTPKTFYAFCLCKQNTSKTCYAFKQKP